MIKLSKAQKRVLWHMANGWEWGVYYNGERLQKGGLGRGGDTINVSVATTSVLYKAGLIKQENRASVLNKGWLTPKGAELAKTIKESDFT